MRNQRLLALLEVEIRQLERQIADRLSDIEQRIKNLEEA